jgi:hypothetical protein
MDEFQHFGMAVEAIGEAARALGLHLDRRRSAPLSTPREE